MMIPRIVICLLAGIPLLSASATAQGFVGVTNNGLLIEIDPVTGAEGPVLLQIPNVQELNGMARRPSDGMLFFAGAWTPTAPRELYSWDPATGAIAVLPLTGHPGISIRGMAFDSAGTLYATNWSSAGAELFTIDEATGVCTSLGALGLPGAVQALAWDDTNGRLVGWNNGSTTHPATPGLTGPGLVHIDPANLPSVDPDPQFQATDAWEIQGLMFDRDGRLISVGFDWPMQELDPMTGQVLWSSAAPISRYLRGVEDLRPRDLQMTLGGSCPGLMTVELSNGTPSAQVAIAYAFGNAGFTVTTGPCAGTVVQLSAPATLLGVYPLDAQGAFTLGPMNVPANACGNVWVQAIDLSNCAQTPLMQP